MGYNTHNIAKGYLKLDSVVPTSSEIADGPVTSFSISWSPQSWLIRSFPTHGVGNAIMKSSPITHRLSKWRMIECHYLVLASFLLMWFCLSQNNTPNLWFTHIASCLCSSSINVSMLTCLSMPSICTPIFLYHYFCIYMNTMCNHNLCTIPQFFLAW